MPRVSRRVFEGVCLGIMAFSLLAHLVVLAAPPELQDAAMRWGAIGTVALFAILSLLREEISEVYATVFGALLVVVALDGLQHRRLFPPNQEHAWQICGGEDTACWELLALWPVLCIFGYGFNRMFGGAAVEAYLSHLDVFRRGGYELIPEGPKDDLEAQRQKKKKKEKKVPHYYKKPPLAADSPWR